MAKIKLKDLPTDKNSPKYLEALIDNVVLAYDTFYSDSTALDYCCVTGKTRSIILNDERYKVLTRKARATKFLAELEEIEGISSDLRGTSIDADDYDIRDTKQKQQYDKDYKDLFGMRLRAAEMRRDLLNMTSSDSEAEELNAVNVFYVALTKAEFEKMKNVEIYSGTDGSDASSAFAETETSGIPEAKSVLVTQAEEVEGGFLYNEDGSVEDF